MPFCSLFFGASFLTGLGLAFGSDASASGCASAFGLASFLGDAFGLAFGCGGGSVDAEALLCGGGSVDAEARLLFGLSGVAFCCWLCFGCWLWWGRICSFFFSFISLPCHELIHIRIRCRFF